jgi:hypothetical protein
MRTECKLHEITKILQTRKVRSMRYNGKPSWKGYGKIMSFYNIAG